MTGGFEGGAVLEVACEVVCSVNVPSSCDCLLVSDFAGYLQHGSITWPDGACCILNVEVPSGRYDA